MKTKHFFAVVAVAVVSVTGLCSFTSLSNSHNEITEEFSTHVHAQGAHCHGIVGCDCPGFSPITNGDIWQQAYCKHCGHKRSFHN